MLKTGILILLTGMLLFFACKRQLHLPNQSPVANAGRDTTIFLPVDFATLDGEASSDADGSISRYQWTKISGPASYAIDNASAVRATVKNLVKGVYSFELKVTDNGGLSAKDTVQIAVSDPAHPNRPPVANAGTDQTIMLPINAVNLDGRASSDPDNNITNYTWTKISGPPSPNIVSAGNVQTQVVNLVQGIYQFELKVMDAGGLFSTDTVQVTATDVCAVSRPLVNAQLTLLGTLSLERTGMTVASAGNKILFAGGDPDNDGMGSSRVDIYDMVTQTWSTAELSVSRWNVNAVTLGNKIFFAGGHTVFQNSWDIFSNVDIYDASTNTWSVAQLSERRMDIAVSVSGNKVFFAGGLGGSGGPPSYVSNKVDVYDNSNNTWTTTTMSEARACLSAVSIGDKIYFPGGNTKHGSYTGSCNPSNRIDIYDNRTGSWSVSSMNESLSYREAVAAGSKVFLAGGLNYNCGNSYVLSSGVEIIDVNSQTSSLACLFQPNAQFKAVVKGNKIIFFTGQGAVKNKFDIYDTITNTWSIGVLSISFQNVATAVAIVGNTIYVADTDKAWKLDF